MPRPAKAEEDKRKVIGTRFDPDVRRAIEQIAETTGASVGSIVEQRVSLFLDCDDQTLALLRDIADEIAAIERSVNGTPEGFRWHEHQEAFAAVEEMLKHGPLQRRKPSLAPDAESHLQREVQAATVKAHIVAQLAQLGLSVKAERYTVRPLAAQGMFGNRTGGATGSMGLGGLLLGGQAPARFDHRITERAAINAIPDDNLRDHATGLFDSLIEQDEIEEAERAAFREAYEPTLELQGDGRDLYRSIRRERATKAMHNGEPYAVSDLM